jgi:hypothetical protein
VRDAIKRSDIKKEHRYDLIVHYYKTGFLVTGKKLGEKKKADHYIYPARRIP